MYKIITKAIFPINMRTNPFKVRNSSTASVSNLVTVDAYHIARRIDTVKAHSGIYSELKKSRLEQKLVTIEIDKVSNQYMSVSSFGSVVLFNVPLSHHADHLKRIKQSILTPLVDGNSNQYLDSYKIMINPQLEKPSVIKAEHVNIRSLDNKNISIISTVMAQSVALDYYDEIIDKMLETFMKLNLNIEQSGRFDNLNAQKLFKLVAENNRVYVTVLSRLGIFEGSEVAWENGDYHDTFEALRKDFDIEVRYKDLSLKLDIVRENSKFFLEVLHNRKSTKLEWTIIILIAAEIAIGIIGLYK